MCLPEILKGSESEGAMDRKEEILQTFSDINYAYNNCTKYDTLKRMLDELTEPCEDCISRQAAIDTLDNTDKFMDEDRTVETYKALLKECYEVLPSVTPKQKMGHWIPVSERLPEEEHGEYFITWTTSMSKRPFIAICEGKVTIEYGFEWILDSYIKCYPNVKVIAWMPLPEPYKAESEDTE